MRPACAGRYPCRRNLKFQVRRIDYYTARCGLSQSFGCPAFTVSNSYNDPLMFGNPSSTLRLTKPERTASMTLGAVFALRLLGIFLILPVFSVWAKGLEGGENTLRSAFTASRRPCCRFPSERQATGSAESP